MSDSKDSNKGNQDTGYGTVKPMNQMRKFKKASVDNKDKKGK